MSKRYIDVAESAKLIRKLLASKFPGVKFSVRSSRYAGGASIDIKWNNGPTLHSVRKYTDPFAGAHFDGMIDLQSYVSSYILPDGTVVHGLTDEQWEKYKDSAEEVRFGSDYVHCSREYTKEFLEETANYFNETHGPSKAVVITTEYGSHVEIKPYDGSVRLWWERLLGEKAA